MPEVARMRDTRAPEPELGALMDHLFRRESGKMVSTLTRVFGIHNLDLAEDVVQEALIQALRQWPFTGIPKNPAAWLYKVAQHRAIDAVRRDAGFPRVAERALNAPGGAAIVEGISDLTFLDEEIKDDTLRMMFTCCHPALPPESQIALTLKILGGFSTAEIARALLAQEGAIARRLSRAKATIRDHQIAFEVPAGEALGERRAAVLRVLYLMFNEGYNAAYSEHPIRRDVCVEAMRLCKLLTEHPAGHHPATHGLLALMCFHAARFDARIGSGGELLMLRSQDRSKWNRALIAEGFRSLDASAFGEEPYEVQIEAGLAAAHCVAPTYEQTDWAHIVRLYDALLALNPSPIIALNRAIAVAEVRGARAGLEALAAIRDRGVLEAYYLYPAVLGELHIRLGDLVSARRYLARAIEATASPAERRFLEEKLRSETAGPIGPSSTSTC
jgi:RNA polymerase sigma-70 factor (ECF subfamily)